MSRPRIKLVPGDIRGCYELIAELPRLQVLVRCINCSREKEIRRYTFLNFVSKSCRECYRQQRADNTLSEQKVLKLLAVMRANDGRRVYASPGCSLDQGGL